MACAASPHHDTVPRATVVDFVHPIKAVGRAVNPQAIQIWGCLMVMAIDQKLFIGELPFKSCHFCTQFEGFI
jgi:hypothetical protein